MMAAAIHERVVANPESSVVVDLAVALVRLVSGNLMHRQPEFPVATIAVGQVAVSRREQRAASDEIGIDELEIEPPPVRIAAVLERNLRGGSQKVALDKSHLPRLVAAHTGEARLRLRAPTVGGDRADDELAVDGRTHGIDTHGSEYAECPQCSLSSIRARSKGSPRFTKRRRRMTHCRVRICSAFATWATQSGASPVRSNTFLFSMMMESIVGAAASL